MVVCSTYSIDRAHVDNVCQMVFYCTVYRMIGDSGVLADLAMAATGGNQYTRPDGLILTTVGGR